MFTSLKSTKKGFTLIELLVVIAIIGILSSVVLASLSTARAKSRDAKRISDVGQIQLALELYFDGAQSYPSSTPADIHFTSNVPTCAAPTSVNDKAVALLTCKNFLPQTPLPPAGSGTMNAYAYRGVYFVTGTATECTAVGTSCTSYYLGITLERSDNTVLLADSDKAIGTFYGSNPDCIVAAAGIDTCYDVSP
ncbi:MAG: hypothetical protein A2942_02255 [Candidatus Lloydbacteria bacterium RIFCSPLOWO2_01_FULL_50_20]|uniref:Type II secretion system protein GspG C-terminal domain-containing protein n=1 Tax=Candidatus Lloydbacteria bacterium RIFCSPLOWO2_01_FULL_50_20 TaxID=1798665 RepID=A0A1G2DEG0_9BACT|nr:MAG: hypothetical protein A2942_02255 [Candidatus Lloydbacteria bacterium RIFCSPLOWO2_01_FULL_50_20]